MKVLHATPTSFSEASVVGGGERYINYVTATAKKHLNSVRHAMLALQADTADLIRGDNYYLINGRPDDVGTIDASGLRMIISEYDVVHVHQCLSNFGIFIAAHCASLRIPVIGTDHGSGDSPILDWNPKLADTFDAFHAQSKFAKAGFARFPSPVEVILGPIDETLYTAREEHPQSSKFIVSTGRILPHKGYDNIIRCMPKDAIYIVIGRPYNEGYLNYLKELAQMEERKVEFWHDADDTMLVEKIKLASIYAQPSVPIDYLNSKHKKSELLGLASLEALAMGVPVVVNSQTALAELSAIDGVYTYRSMLECKILLRNILSRDKMMPPPAQIRESTISIYGLEQFALKYEQLLTKVCVK